MSDTIHKNMATDMALRLAAAAGVPIRQGKGGEVVVTFPGRHPLRFNSRRRGCPQVLVARLRQMLAP